MGGRRGVDPPVKLPNNQSAVADDGLFIGFPRYSAQQAAAAELGVRRRKFLIGKRSPLWFPVPCGTIHP
jgi:hypothetical protein